MGEGILIKVETPFNGLSVDYKNAKCVVWYGSENGQDPNSGTKWITHEYYYETLLIWNKDKIREEKLDELGI